MVASDPISIKKIDLDTINSLQLLAPGKSRADGKTACGLVLSGQAFAEFSEEERRIIWNRLKDFDGLIPSLYTFFEDFKYLESCAHCVKRLFGPQTESVWQTMRSMFIPSLDSEAEESFIQTSESTFRRQRATDVERLEMGYLQVWLYTMRHYPLMPPDPKKEDDLLAKPVRVKADERAIYEMAELARRLGFKSPEIDALIDGSPDHQIARAALLQARKPGRFRYDAQQFDILASRIVDCFAAAILDQPDMVDFLADSTVKPRARCGMPRTRTHKQDSSFFFLDRLHADEVEVADTITSFFVRRCVYFAFFGKPARPGPNNSDQTEESPGGMSWSPLFVAEDGPSGDRRSAMQAAPPTEPSQQEREGPQQPRPRGDGEQHTLRRQHARRLERERNVLRRRRTRKAQMRTGQSRPTSEDVQEPMELERLSTNPPDQDMSDQEPLFPETLMADSHDESISFDSATALQLHSPHGLDVAEEADTFSHCTRISLEATPLGRLSEARPTVEGPCHDDDIENQAQLGPPSQPQPTEIEDGSSSCVGGPSGQQSALNEYLDQLKRAQEEQEKLEERLERERLEEDFGVSHQEQPVLEPSSGPAEGQNPPLTGADNQPAEVTHTENTDLVQAVVAEPTQDPLPASRPEEQPETSVESRPTDTEPPISVEATPPPGFVEISFWSFEREEWKQTDRLKVDPSDPSPVERIAKKYSWKNYSLYDRNLQSLSPAQCYRAATVDGNNAVLLISEHEEQRLAAEGRLVKDRQLLSLVSRVLDRAEPESKKRHPRSSVTSEEL